jgi:hypothetical protein
LVHEYLCARDDKDREAALNGLIQCCQKACKRLYVPRDPLITVRPGTSRTSPNYKAVTSSARLEQAMKDDGLTIVSDYSAMSRYERNEDFFEENLTAILGEYAKLGREQIDRRALAGEFRWIVRQVRHRLIDLVRRQYAERRRQERVQKNDISEPPQYKGAVLPAVERERGRLIRLIGHRPYETLAMLAAAAPFGESKRDRKGNSARAVATGRRVTVQQARADRRAMIEAVTIDPLARHFAEQVLGADLVQ